MRLSHILSAFLLLSGLLAVACDPQSAALAARFPPIVRATHSDYRTPRWSPDGTVITYEVNSAPDAEVWVASVDGRPPRRVTDASAYASQPDWSSDGKLIIYAGLSNKVAQLFTISPDGSGVTQVTHLSQFARSPKWSPDGARIAFALNTGKAAGGFQLHIMNTSGQGVVQLTRAPLGEVEHLEWSPGNDRIAFVAKDITQETVQTQFGDAIGPFLYLINADGTGQRRLVDRPGEYYPTWSPDGMQILFYLLDHSTEKQLPAGFYVMNADGSSMRGVLAEGVCREPNWGRANNKLAFVCGQLPVMAPLILTADMQDLLK